MPQNPYYVDPGNDFSSGLAGLSSAMSGIRRDRIMQAEQQRQQEREERAQKRFEEVQGAAMKAFDSQDPDFIAKTSIQYPEITEMLRQTAGLQDELKNKEALGFTRAFATASPESRPALYEQRIKSIQERGGDPTHTIQSYQDYMRDPEAETRDVVSYWAGIDPKGYSVYSDERKAEQKAALEAQKQQAADSRFDRAEAGRNQRAAVRNSVTARAGGAGGGLTANQKDFQAYQELKKTDPVAATEFGRQAGFVSKEGKELSPQVQKRLSVATDDAIAAENNTAKFTSLANEIERANISGGVAGQFSEKLKEVTGEQDAVSALRREYNAIKGSQVVNNLPPGAASDKDIELAMAGFPSDRANGQQIAGFLRGIAKLQSANAELQNFKADYISENGTERGMLQAWKGQKKSAPRKSEAAPASQGAAPSVTTQAQFDALPSGAVYLEDGVQYRKP